MKNKEKIMPIVVFITTFVIVITIFFIINNQNKNKYSCYDYENDKNYTFNTEEEMHEVCDKITGEETDKVLTKNSIYNDLINVDDPSFSFYPHVDSNKELSIIIAISDCKDPEGAKEKAKNWFKNNSYDINDYVIEYEYPCEVD